MRLTTSLKALGAMVATSFAGTAALAQVDVGELPSIGKPVPQGLAFNPRRRSWPPTFSGWTGSSLSSSR